jgi:Tol biopolymer transport system component
VEAWLDPVTGAAVEPATAAGGEVLWSTTSPDGEWTAALEQSRTGDDEAPYRVRLTLVNDSRTRIWTAVDRAQLAGLGGTTPKDLRWSADGLRFYFTNVAAVDGCAWFVNGSGLYSVDLDTGRVTELMPEMGLALALSPDEQRVAYVAFGERGLVVRDVMGGEEQPVGLSGGPEALTITQLAWSPDSEQLAVTLIADACTQLEPGRYLTMIVDAETGEARTLLDNDPRLLTLVEWTEPGRVQLMDWDGGLWWLDVATGAVTAT